MLIPLSHYNIRSKNFYFHNYEKHNITKDEIVSLGVTDEVHVDAELIGPLIRIQEDLQKQGREVFIKEGYRSKELYELIYKKRVEKYRQEETGRLFNMSLMPHSTGKSIDVSLWDSRENKEIPMRKNEDDVNALFVDFYKNSQNEEERKYFWEQHHLIELMQKHGFRLGTKREYFHFDYSPESEKNYFYEVPLVILEKISIITTDVVEAHALRAVLESMYDIEIHYVGSRAHFLHLLSHNSKPYCILSLHGAKTGFIMNNEQDITPKDIKDHAKLSNTHILSLACLSGTQEFADAFFHAGALSYTTPYDYPDATTALMFALHTFLSLFKENEEKITYKTSIEKARHYSKESEMFLFYNSSLSS